MATAYPTTPDLTIKAGDYVRSYDFPGRTDCYYEGVVEAVEARGVYRIAVNARVLEGKPDFGCEALYVWAPVNGQQGILGETRGVVRVDEPEL